MSKNLVEDGKYILLPLDDKVSGQPIVLGAFVGVAENDTEKTPEGALIGTVCDVRESIYSLPVTAGAGDINIGDKLYIDPADDSLSDDNTKTFYGIAYSKSVAGTPLILNGNSATIQVRLRGSGGA